MADRNWARDQSAIERGLVQLDFSINIGATGAPTLPRTGTGVASVTRTAAGTYTITLEDAYVSLIGAGITTAAVQNTFAQSTAILNGTAAQQDVSVAKQVKFYTAVTTPAADLPSGSSVHFTLVLKNSQV